MVSWLWQLLRYIFRPIDSSDKWRGWLSMLIAPAFFGGAWLSPDWAFVKWARDNPKHWALIVVSVLVIWALLRAFNQVHPLTNPLAIDGCRLVDGFVLLDISKSGPTSECYARITEIRGTDIPIYQFPLRVSWEHHRPALAPVDRHGRPLRVGHVHAPRGYEDGGFVSPTSAKFVPILPPDDAPPKGSGYAPPPIRPISFSHQIEVDTQVIVAESNHSRLTTVVLSFDPDTNVYCVLKNVNTT